MTFLVSELFKTLGTDRDAQLIVGVVRDL